MTTITPWRAVVNAALASRRADCGHPISRKPNPLIWLRTEKVGGITEVWSACYDCHTENDYEYLDGVDARPRRDRIEYL